MGFAEGGQVAHFNLGGFGADRLGSIGGNPINSNFMNESQAARRQAELRLMKAQARSAFSAAPIGSAPPGIGSLLSRATLPATLGLAGYEYGKDELEKRQAAELAKYGPEPEPTEEDFARAAGPITQPFSMNRKLQKNKPLAPLSYTPAGVETLGPREGYTPPTRSLNPVKEVAKAPAAAVVPAKEEIKAAPAEEPVAPPVAAQAPAAPAKEEPDDYGEYLKMLRGGYEDVKKSKAEDKYLALLAAGLGMMGGTSPHAAANIGAGAMQGISFLSDANKQRMAEKAAIDKSLGQGLYYQGRQKDLVTSRADLLKEQIRAHDLTADAAKTRAAETANQNAEKNFEFARKAVEAAYTKNISNINKSDADRDAFVYSHPLVIAKAKAAGIDLSGLGQIDKYPGFSLKTPK
jgi:hypothetical protein